MLTRPKIPIDASNPKRNLFFAFHPTVGKPVDEITIWLNGGPGMFLHRLQTQLQAVHRASKLTLGTGCSSLEGFFQENGVTWQPGTDTPVVSLPSI